MDLRLGPPSRDRILPHARAVVRPRVPSAEQGLRMVMEQAPKAEALAAHYVERTRPLWSWFERKFGTTCGRWLAGEWRRMGTGAALLLIAVLLLHAMFGANGFVVYRQKHAEMQSLNAEVDRLQKENEDFAATIKALKSDPSAIEKEAREQLHYTRPGEYVYVAPEPPPRPPTGRAQNRK